MLCPGLLLCACAHRVSALSAKNSLRVNIQQGPVIGYKATEDVYAFYAISYATAPTGRQTLRPPLPPPSWIEPLKAVLKDIILCPQDFSGTDVKGGQIKMQEDCLKANVFVPDTKEKMLAVVVQVHGGYQHGYGLILTPINQVKTANLVGTSRNKLKFI